MDPPVGVLIYIVADSFEITRKVIEDLKFYLTHKC